MKILIPFSLLAFVFSSCLIQIVTGNDYKNLPQEYKNLISKLSSFDNLESKKIYEINGLQLKEELAKYDSSLLYFYLPACDADACLPLISYENYAANKNYKLFLIPVTYSSIGKSLVQDFNSPLFAVDADYYNIKQSRKYVRAFKKDLGYNALIHSHFSPLYLIFHKDSLVGFINDIK